MDVFGIADSIALRASQELVIIKRMKVVLKISIKMATLQAIVVVVQVGEALH
jgi:hypothetical protein